VFGKEAVAERTYIKQKTSLAERPGRKDRQMKRARQRTLVDKAA
jgi:hypothetical protein